MFASPPVSEINFRPGDYQHLRKVFSARTGPVVNPAIPNPPQPQGSPWPGQPERGGRQATFTLDEGPATLVAPATLSESSSAVLADLFELFLRRTKCDAND